MRDLKIVLGKLRGLKNKADHSENTPGTYSPSKMIATLGVFWEFSGRFRAYGKKFVNIQADFGDFLKTWKIDK